MSLLVFIDSTTASSTRTKKRMADLAQIIAKLDSLKIEIRDEIKTQTGRNLAVDIKKFKGRVDDREFSDFIKEYCRLGDSFDWNEEKLLRNFPQVICGEALAMYELLKDNEKVDWDALKRNMSLKFLGDESEALGR